MRPPPNEHGTPGLAAATSSRRTLSRKASSGTYPRYSPPRIETNRQLLWRGAVSGSAAGTRCVIVKVAWVPQASLLVRLTEPRALVMTRGQYRRFSHVAGLLAYGAMPIGLRLGTRSLFQSTFSVLASNDENCYARSASHPLYGSRTSRENRSCALRVPGLGLLVQIAGGWVWLWP